MKYFEYLGSCETVIFGLTGSEGVDRIGWAESGLDWVVDGSGTSTSDCEVFVGISEGSASAATSSRPGMDAN